MMARLNWVLVLVSLCAAAATLTGSSVRYVRISRSGYNYMGFQEVQLINEAGTNVASGCSVTASGPYLSGWGSPSSAVDGAYGNSANDMLVERMNNPWIELDLISLSNFTLTMLNLYVNFRASGDNNWGPCDTITFMDCARNVVATHTLSSSWAGVSIPYTVSLAMTSCPIVSSAFRNLPNTTLDGTPFSTSLGVGNEALCALSCTNTPSCTGYSWSSPSAVTSNPCSLYKGVTSYGTNTLSNSGVLLSAPTPTLFDINSFRALPNTDLAGSPFSTVFGATPLEYQCAFYCSYTPPCTGYTWSSSSFLASNPCCACRLSSLSSSPIAHLLTPPNP